MAKPKVIVQIYPMLPAEDRADRERKRPLGRNRDVYQQVRILLMNVTQDNRRAVQPIGFSERR